MNEKLKRALSISTVVHVLVFFLIILIPLITRWLTPRKINDTISFVDLVSPSDGLPELVQEQEPEPEPEPEPIKKETIPEPPVKPVITEAKKPADKPKIQVSTNLVRKPKAPAPKGPKLTPAEIKKLLAAGVVSSSGGSPSSGDTSAMTIYYASVKAAMYEAWDQPDGLSAGLVTQVSIHIQRDGSITTRRMTRGSGNALMDESVMRAVQSVSKLRPLPDARESYMDISIDFELTGNTL